MSDHDEDANTSFDGNVKLLTSMGIDDEEYIRKVLRQTSNDLEQACVILFPDDGHQMTSHESYDHLPECNRDMEMQDSRISQTDSDRDSTTVSYSLEEDRIRDLDEGDHPEDPPPSYEESIDVDDHQQLPPVKEMDTYPPESDLPPMRDETRIENSPITEETTPIVSNSVDDVSGDAPPRNVEFPLTNYYELEARVHTEQWSIPYKREESLAKCMLAATDMMREGANVAEADENCVKFLTKTMPCSFEKLLTHEAVAKWDDSIMKGIREMTQILLELISVRLTYKPVPVYLLDLLSIAFNANATFHTHNRSRSSNHQFWVTNLGEEGVLAQSPSFTTRKDPKGWLVEFMNYFAFHNGVARIRANILDKDAPPTLQELTALFNPFSACDDYILPNYFKAEMSECMLFAMHFIEDLKDDLLKDKEVGCVFDLLKTLKTLFRRCGGGTSDGKVDNLRLKTTLRMFQIPHYNAKMNALKEVVRLTEEPYAAARAGVKNPISTDKVMEWLINNKVLSIAFGGNLHQAQYCDKVKSIVEFLGNSLSLDELSNIWEMQVDKNPAQVENIHNILAYAASRFNALHMDHLFQLIQKSWEAASSDSYREKLLGFIGKIGKDDRTGKTAPKILNLLWSLAHSPQLSREMVELALNSHYSILIDSYHVKDTERRLYISKCADDIKKCQWVVAAISHLHRLAKGMYNSRHGHKDQQQVADLQKQYDLLRVTAATLSKIHCRNVQQCQEKLTGKFVMDGRYTHEECVDACLQFMSFLLRDGALYLPTKRANEIWDILIANEDACADDRRLAFKWFDNSMGDLEYDTQCHLFTKRVLKVDPVLLDIYGYRCVRSFFETINLNERKLRKLQHSLQLIVDSPDLTGLDYLWKAALEVTDKNIADELISSILQISYTGLNQKLKRDPVGLHQKFIDDCFIRLDSLCDPSLEDTDQEKRTTCIERLLLLAQRYILTVEEIHTYPRQIPPHGSCYRGNPIRLSISIDQKQRSFYLDCHTNETILSVRHKIGKQLSIAPEQVQIGTTEKWLSIHHFNKLIHQMGFTDGQILIVKVPSMQGLNNFDTIDSPDRLQAALKQEKTLPGVLMSTRKDVYDKLESLCASHDPRIQIAVRNLLSLIPINDKVLKGLEIFIDMGPGISEDSPDPKAVLEDFYSTKNGSATELLYNLEVLSGKLIPSSLNSTNDTTSQIFRKNFLEAGGLKYIIDIFQNSAFPLHTNILIIQDCYVIALSLIRVLLCDPSSSTTTTDTVPPDNNVEELGVETMEDTLEDKPSLCRQMSKTRHVEDEVARLTIETMSVDDFTLMLTYLTEVCWMTAAGRLDLITAQDKTGTLSAGICSKTDIISHKDITISCECFELLVMCLNLRKNDIPILYKLPKVEEFLIDVLIGSASSFTRGAMMDYLHELCDSISIYSATTIDTGEDSDDKPQSSITEVPHYYFLHLLLSNPSSLWKHKSTDTDDLVTWERCNEYFEFLVSLLRDLTEFDQKYLKVDINKMINTEIEWLGSMSFDDLESHGVQVLLAGHLKLCTALFSCEGVDKKACSGQLIHKLLNEFLFPASILTQDNPEVLQSGIVNVTAKCHSIPARVAAYGLLIELSKDCAENYRNIAHQLIMMHHRQRPENNNEWEFRPLVDGRSRCGYVGLKNAGATCYMNSVLQQLYVQPGIREKLLEVERDEEDASILPDIQTIFGHLMKSNLQYYTPDVFWKNFKLEGRHINVLEHQDASEFFSSLTDQVDEALKKRDSPKVFEGRFGGQFLDQIICHGCEHRFEKEQGFTTLQLSVVQSKSLVESLQEFVRGDMLEGDNRYLCGECDEKRDTLKRTCLKTLPTVLVVHLKRFDYDWETNREIKFNNYFEFPWYLDLEPYTAEGITSREKGLGSTPERMYELTGIIVHQGQASAGHYYAFIKDKKRPNTHSSNEDTPFEVEDMELTPPDDKEDTPPPVNRWLRFNDTVVEEYVFTDVLLEAECFGGSIKTSSADPLHNSHPETKVRHWNAYMLFYEAVHPVTHTDKPAPSEDTTPTEESPCVSDPVSKEDDSTNEEKEDNEPSQVMDEVQKEEEEVTIGSSGVSIEDCVPLDIQKSVNIENLRFMQNRDIYCRQYFDFIWKLVGCNELATFNPVDDTNSPYGSISIELTLKFLLHTFFRSFKDLRKTHRESWVKVTEKLLISCPVACKWLIEYFSSSKGDFHLKPFLLECSTKEVREDFTDILSCALHSYCASNEIENDGPVDRIISFLLQLLENDVIDSCKTCAQYFNLLRNYANHRPGVHHLLSKDTFSKLVKFLLGTTSPPIAIDSEPPRRWSSVQVKEFGGIYGALALMIRNSDFSVYESENVPNEVTPENPYMIPNKREDLLPPSEGMHDVLFVIVNSNSRFIKECSQTLRDSDIITTDSISSIFCYCCWNNQTFSASVLGELQSQIHSVPATELRSYFRVLMDILLVEDSLQEKRISFTFKGGKYDPDKAIFRTIRESNESKRIYQGIKFLVGIARKSKAGRAFILSQSEQLQHSVIWLKKRINEYSWSSSTTFSNESSSSKVFKRSISSQDTLEEANALLHELESRESKVTQQQQQTRPVVSSNNNGHSHTNGHNSNNDIEG